MSLFLYAPPSCRPFLCLPLCVRFFFLTVWVPKSWVPSSWAPFVLFSFWCFHVRKCLFAKTLSLLEHFPTLSSFFAIALSLFTIHPPISNFPLCSHAIFYIWFSLIFSFSLPHWSSPSTLSSLSLCSPPPPIPPSHPLPLSLSLSSRSLPFFAQDRSALITLMALMIQLNGALSPQCLSKAFLCSMLTQQHSTVTADSALSVSALTVTSRYYRTGHGEICLSFVYLSRILRV